MSQAAAGGGGFTDPSSVAGLWGWWDDTTLPAGADGTAISQWDDRSGNARHLLQATGTNKPTKKTSIVNSLDVARFTTDDWLSLTGITPPGVANPSDLTLFVVYRPGAGNGVLVSCRDGSNGWIYRTTNTTNSAILFGHIGATPNVTDTPGDANFNIVEIVRTALSCVAGHNGTMAGASAISAYGGPTTSRLDVGAEAGTLGAAPSQQFLGGDIAAVLIYTTALATTDRDNVETWLGNRYNITVV